MEEEESKTDEEEEGSVVVVGCMVGILLISIGQPD